MGLRIDNLTPGDVVTLNFGKDAGQDEQAVFVRMASAGDDRRAEFAQGAAGDRTMYVWQAYRYRYMGHWAYGTSADRLKLVSIDKPNPNHKI